MNFILAFQKRYEMKVCVLERIRLFFFLYVNKNIKKNLGNWFGKKLMIMHFAALLPALLGLIWFRWETWCKIPLFGFMLITVWYFWLLKFCDLCSQLSKIAIWALNFSICCTVIKILNWSSNNFISIIVFFSFLNTLVFFDNRLYYKFADRIINNFFGQIKKNKIKSLNRKTLRGKNIKCN